MSRMSMALFLALACSACAYRPTAVETLRINDSPADMNACRRLGDVSPVVATVPDFEDATQDMLNATLALGGTDLLLRKQSASDWSLVRGEAYYCSRPGPYNAVRNPY